MVAGTDFSRRENASISSQHSQQAYPRTSTLSYGSRGSTKQPLPGIRWQEEELDRSFSAIPSRQESRTVSFIRESGYQRITSVLQSAAHNQRETRMSRALDLLCPREMGRASSRVSMRMFSKNQMRMNEIYSFLEDTDSSRGAKLFSYLVMLVSMSSVLVEFTKDPNFLIGWDETTRSIVNYCIDAFFLLDVILRFVCCPQKRTFFKSGLHVEEQFATKINILNLF